MGEDDGQEEGTHFMGPSRNGAFARKASGDSSFSNSMPRAAEFLTASS